MIDYAKITVKAGDGGNGVGSFKHVKGKRLGKADGGDGGDGGNVYIEATGDLNTLEPYRYVKDYAAKNGQNGYSNLRRGARAADLVLKVPLGTQVDIFSGPVSDFLPVGARSMDKSVTQDKSSSLRAAGSPSTAATRKISTLDLVDPGQRVLVARGGEGGRGNAKLRDEFGRRPKAGEKGTEGETVNLVLELKLIADVGIIGMPNAGKSTFLNAVTRAKAQVADYPFTTLEPNLGVFEVKVESQSGKLGTKKLAGDSLYTSDFDFRLVLADIPGLIEGASEGKGLGDLFLRHIERTRLLLHFIDASTVTDKLTDYKKIRDELKKYSKELAKKKEIVVLTKIDLISKEALKQIEDQFKKKRKKVFAISAVSGAGVESLLGEILKRLK